MESFVPPASFSISSMVLDAAPADLRNIEKFHFSPTFSAASVANSTLWVTYPPAPESASCPQYVPKRGSACLVSDPPDTPHDKLSVAFSKLLSARYCRYIRSARCAIRWNRLLDSVALTRSVLTHFRDSFSTARPSSVNPSDADTLTLEEFTFRVARGNPFTRP